MSDIQLSLELAGEKVNLEIVGETARDLRQALRDIERHVTDTEPKAVWRWDDQALLTAAASPNGVNEGTLLRIVQELRDGFQKAEEASGQPVEWPPTFGPTARKAVNKILGRLSDLDYIRLDVEGTDPLTIERAVIRKEVGRAAGYAEITSIDGVLDLISVRGRPSFMIEEHGTGRRVRCVFPDEMMPSIKEALGNRAVVEGTVRFREDGSPVSITNITSLFIRPPAPRPIEELAGSLPNFTGGLSPEDYIRQMRSGNEEE